MGLSLGSEKYSLCSPLQSDRKLLEEGQHPGPISHLVDFPSRSVQERRHSLKALFHLPQSTPWMRNMVSILQVKKLRLGKEVSGGAETLTQNS